MAAEDDDKPRKKISHEIGQDLSLLSVGDVEDRIAMLAAEIERLKREVNKLKAERDILKKAAAFFAGEAT